ncbi:MAG: uracil-DNA glycosylase family protein [Halobacteriaceae archaeon]
MTEEGRMEGLDVVACERCPRLVEARSRIVNGVGPADAAILFVGEAPGATEDEQGEPFVGRSGGVLDEALGEYGLARRDVRITNCVRCRPPENRDPRAAERANCRSYLDREVAAVDPDLVVALGKVPAEHLLDRDVAVTSEAGTVEEAAFGDGSWPVLVCLHPAATLYDRSQRSTFRETVGRAAAFVGATDGGQSRIDEF